jgi:hypothetical protein
MFYLGWVTKTLCTQKEANAFPPWNNNLRYQGILELRFKDGTLSDLVVFQQSPDLKPILWSTLLEIRVLQGFLTNTYNKPYPTCIGFFTLWTTPKGFTKKPSRCEKHLRVFKKTFRGFSLAKHKSGVIYRFHLTVPPLATTLRKMVTQSVRMGNAHANRRSSYEFSYYIITESEKSASVVAYDSYEPWLSFHTKTCYHHVPHDWVLIIVWMNRPQNACVAD